MASARSEKTEPFIIVILGCTGTGKSKLSIEIARQIGGEIISADSMQVYKGLDVITNKVTQEERALIPHHLLDFVEANQTFSVVEFKTMALNIISDIHRRQKVPIIVGGTNYYIESLLWENLINEKSEINLSAGKDTAKSFLRQQTMQSSNNLPSSQATDTDEILDCSGKLSSAEGSKSFSRSSITPFAKQCTLVCNKSVERHVKTPVTQQTIDTRPISKINDTKTQNDLLHQKLSKVDSVMATKLHPNDTRKIKRSLQVFEQSGIPHSEHIERQHTRKGSSQYGGPMRFKNVCVLWLQCDFESLDTRLDARVEQMIQQGLVEELIQFQSSCENDSSESQIYQDEGIFQSIGFKEFREFLKRGNGNIEEHPKLFQDCVAAMKCATRRYARKQVRWVKNRFLGRPPTSSPDVYGLDVTDLSQWRMNVLEKALYIVKSFQKGQHVGHSPLERVVTGNGEKHSNHVCGTCNGRIIIGSLNWEAHLRSRSHRHYKKKQQKLNDART